MSGVAVQREYYARTALRYDDAHAADEHAVALEHVLAWLRSSAAESLLDSGCGTGRALRLVRERAPHVRVRGNDPVPELLRIATERHGVPAELLDVARSEALPYPDASFDAVVAIGVMHHVPDPAAVVAELVRVARRAVFVSDANIYGAGPPASRIVKLALARTGLLRPLNRLRRGGRDWFYSDDDGVAYSYSVYDSLADLRKGCKRVEIVPTARGGARRPPVLLRSSHCLLCGFKEQA